MNKRALGLVGMSVCFSVFAHGTIETPISRIYQCYKENPESPKSAACKAAVELGGTQPLYNWNEINQGSANDRHRDLIPDGQLCGGGRDFYKGMNLARPDWVTTAIQGDANGKYTFVFNAPAPHSTKYFQFYVTKDGYDPNQALKWSDLEPNPFCTINSVTLNNGRYAMECTLPANKTGKHVIYMIWQRADSPEAFYSCSDVYLNTGSGTDPNTPPVTSWFELQTIYGTGDIAAGTKVSLRLFKNGTEVDTQSVTVTEANRLSTQWPIALAQAVNAHSTLVRIGQLDPSTGAVTPSDTEANKVYLNDSVTQNYQVAIDFTEPNSQVDFIYPDGIAQYKAGTIVMGRNDHLRYECKPWPYSAWCQQSPTYYEPGVGLAWAQAWTLLNNLKK